MSTSPMYAQTERNELTSSSLFVAIPGLSITLPEGVGTMGLVFLNVPMPYATGNNTPGGTFGLSINGAMSPVVAGFTYNEQNPPGHRPNSGDPDPWSAPDQRATDHRGDVAGRARQHGSDRYPGNAVGDVRLTADIATPSFKREAHAGYPAPARGLIFR